MNNNLKLLIIITFMPVILCGCMDNGDDINHERQTFYVSSINGNDSNDGLSEQTPLKSIDKVNELNLYAGDKVLFECDSIFRGYLEVSNGDELNPITYSTYGEGEQPMFLGSTSVFDVDDFEQLQDDIYGIVCYHDVGNIIMNEGEKFGVKKFSLHEVSEPLDYYYDVNKKILFIMFDEELENIIANEHSEYYSVEFCRTKNIIDMHEKHDVIFENLSLKYGGAHGFGGGNTHRVSIMDCTISYMGGGLLFYLEDGTPVRYGNGVEVFNTGSDILVSNCTIYEIFDTAVTNQGAKNKAYHKNITYEFNTIYNCGMGAFELWLKGKDTEMDNIRFINNNVNDIGCGFSTTQHRENADGLGFFVIDYGSDAAMSNIDISDNTFDTAINIDGSSASILLWEIDDINTNEIYAGFTNNRVLNVDYSVVYSIDGEVKFIE